MNDEENNDIPEDITPVEPNEPDAPPADAPPADPPPPDPDGSDAVPPPPPEETNAMSDSPPDIPQEEIDAGKTFAILGYIIPLLAIVPLIQRDNDFSLYHARQVLMIIIGGIAGSVINVIPCLGQIASLVIIVGVFVFAIMGIINAANGVAKPLPLIGKFGEEWFKGITKNPS